MAYHPEPICTWAFLPGCDFHFVARAISLFHVVTHFPDSESPGSNHLDVCSLNLTSNSTLPGIVGFLSLSTPIFLSGCWFALRDLSTSTIDRPGSQAHFIITHFAHSILINSFFGYTYASSICVSTISRCYNFNNLHFYLISYLDSSIAWLWITAAAIVFPGIVFSDPIYSSSRSLYQHEIIWSCPWSIWSTFHSSLSGCPWAPVCSDPSYPTIFSCLNANAFWTADSAHFVLFAALGL